MSQRPIQGASGLSVPAGPSFWSYPSRPTSLEEPRQSVIPRKRNSDVALTELSDSDSDAPRPKRPRLDFQHKHPLLAVNPNLPPYVTTQRTIVVPNPPVMTAPAGSPGSEMPQPALMQGPSMPQGPVQSINELQGERARAAATLSQLRASLSTGPDVDRDLASGYINVWQQHLSVIDNQIAEMQMAAAPERSAVSPNPHPPFLVPSSAYASVTPELAPPQTTHDAHLGIVESEGEASNAENNQPNEHLSLPMPDHALSTVVASQPAKYVGATEYLDILSLCLQFAEIPSRLQ